MLVTHIAVSVQWWVSTPGSGFLLMRSLGGIRDSSGQWIYVHSVGATRLNSQLSRLTLCRLIKALRSKSMNGKVCAVYLPLK